MFPSGAEPVGQWPVTFGVPFPEGSLWDVSDLRLVNRAGREIASQKEATGHWSREGAIQWVRFDALATPEEGCFVEAAAPGPEALPTPPVRLSEEGGHVVLDTGEVRYVLALGSSPIKEIRMGGRAVAVSAGCARVVRRGPEGTAGQRLGRGRDDEHRVSRASGGVRAMRGVLSDGRRR